ncbi:unnamed protein product [Somion occarium]|uniref:Response regulatory domain-containing protein n=3 Tax=Somion occarium TaxID=3059160 RepID=A0ABP1D2Y8_9APHY
MSGTRLPAVRIPSVIAGQSGSQDVSQESIVVELPSSSKFAIAWPAESSAHVSLPLAERPVTLSSSEGEAEVSEDEHEEEHDIPTRRASRLSNSDADFATPTNHLDDHNPMDDVPPQPPPLPRLSRAFSMPLPSQLGSLQHPGRTPPSSESDTPSVSEVPPELGHFQDLSLELADSVQMVIQTLLQLSPPQVLDPAKEQFSACSLSIPTPSISAMFTSMKNLNYMSANMSAFTTDPETPLADAMRANASVQAQHDFDVGEMLQSVGDALSGVAAQAGIDLVLFHGDVGMKHVAVRGDESGISYTLAHVVRQVIATCQPSDVIELGLFIESVREDQDPEAVRSTPSPDPGGYLRCIFYIAHKFGTGQSGDITANRTQPHFSSLILRRLLRHIGGAVLDVEANPRDTFVGRSYEMSIVLEPGELTVLNPPGLITPEEAALVGYPEYRIAQEPTLEELNQFTESLRGKKVTLHASSRGSFAHHLSSYLTAWGMDVSHMSPETDAEDQPQERTEVIIDPSAMTSGSTSNQDSSASTTSTGTSTRSSNPFTFILIDDDVKVLRSRLEKIRTEQGYPLHLQGRKRPSLATNHRPRSSPQVARVMGLAPASSLPPAHVVIVHFTSLANFKLVKDALQSSLAYTNGIASRMPEVIVIPKPAGPRRFLTALHTAVTKPVVDPFFVPIATSPLSPGVHGISPLFNVTNAPRSPSGRSSGSPRTASDRSTRSPKEHPEAHPHGPSSPLANHDGMEYFSDAVAKLGASPSTGLMIQSPDGQPAGIFFHPKARGISSTMTTPSPRMERDSQNDANRNRNASFRLPSEENKSGFSFAQGIADMTRPSPRPTVNTPDSGESASSGTLKGKSIQVSAAASDGLPSASSDQSIAASEQAIDQSNSRLHRRSSQTSPPSSPQGRSPGGQTALSRRLSRKPHPDSRATEKKKGAGEGNIVPPISVLIVDDNPINQTILSTFMKKKKIKYDVAKNGEEAVQKWKSGAFHLILMDIQMPVMDGIQATKEIRRIEKQNGAVGFPTTPQSDGQQTPSDTSTSDSRSTMTPYRSSVIIVALTASSLQTDRVAALAAGCNDFLTKPVSLQWLNSKIIEWGSIKALQMWADIRPEVVKSISTGQDAQARHVARRLHVPEGKCTPTGMRSRSTSASQRTVGPETPRMVRGLAAAEKISTVVTPPSDESPAVPTSSLAETAGKDPIEDVKTAQPDASTAAPGPSDDTSDEITPKPSVAAQFEATSTDLAPAFEEAPSGPPPSDKDSKQDPPEPQ